MSQKLQKRIEFRIPKIDKKGNQIKNEAGDLVYETYIYSFEEMGMDRKLMARKFFHLSNRNLANQPKEPEHIEIIADRQLEIKAFSAILMKVLDDGKFELYEPATTQLSAYVMSEIGKSVEDWDKLMEVQEDFFSKVRLQSHELMMQSNGIMMQSFNIMKEVISLAGESGIKGLGDLKEFTNLILDKALQSNSEPANKSETNTTV